MYNIKVGKLRSNIDEYGSLIAVEGEGNIPFIMNRAYYIFNVPSGVRRGFHSHRSLQQAIICTSGSVKILVKTPKEEQTVLLDSPDKVLFIGSMVWREMFDFEENAVLLVLASHHYNVEDYIRKYDDYEKLFYAMDKQGSLPLEFEE